MIKSNRMEVEIAPLRSMDDFLLNSARFQVPNFKDLEKWGNRVVHNLLYYQTNYFLLAIVIFIIVGVMHPVKMVCGMLAMGVAFGLFYYFTSGKPEATRFKKNHPILGIGLVLIGSYLIVYMLGSVVVFLFGILLPIMVIFIHASMRQRSIKNKFVNKIEGAGLKCTPMGVFLDALASIRRYEESFRNQIEESTKLAEKMTKNVGEKNELSQKEKSRLSEAFAHKMSETLKGSMKSKYK